MRWIAVLSLLGCLGLWALAGPPQKPPRTNDKQLVETRGTSQVPGGKPLYASSHALIIGINKYPNLPAQNQLSYAVKDATDLKNVLVKSYGFDPDKVVLLTDSKATLSNIRDVLSAFADSNKIGRDDRIIVYFSGHGQTVPTPDGGDMGYLIPSDARVDLSNPNNSGPYLNSCLPMRQIWDYLAASPAKHALVVADACFSGLMARMRGGLSKQAAAVLLGRKARMVLTGGSKGEQTTERSDLGHGVFTAKLIEELNARAATPGNVFTVSDLYSSLQSGVASATNGKQNPQIGSFEADGDVLFVSGGFAPPSTFGDRGTTTGAVTLSITSDPPGAAVSIDGVDTGKITPCDLPLSFKPDAKTAEVKLTLQGYRDSTFTVNNTGKDIQLQGHLQVASDAGHATVHVASKPEGAEILVNGQPTGKVTPADIEIPVNGSAIVVITQHLNGYTNRVMRLKPTVDRVYTFDVNFLAAGTSHQSGDHEAPTESPKLTDNPKLNSGRQKIVAELDATLKKLNTDFISQMKRDSISNITYRFQEDGTRSYQRDFDQVKEADAKSRIRDYQVALKSCLPNWRSERIPDSNDDNFVQYAIYKLDEYEVRLEATKVQERPDLLERAQGKSVPQDRYSIHFIVIKHPQTDH